jgi:rhamnulose-1-phosphate aldolase
LEKPAGRPTIGPAVIAVDHESKGGKVNEPGSKIRTIQEETAQVAGILWERGWAERNAGNLSVDITEELNDSGEWQGGQEIPLDSAYPSLAERGFLVTGTGHRFRDCAIEVEKNTCLLRLNEAGDGFQILSGGSNRPGFRPTSEFPSHLRIHELLRRKEHPEKFVLHTHPTELVALSHHPDYQAEEVFNKALWTIHPEVKVFLPDGVGLVPYMLPGTEKLADATVEALERGHSVALWKMHGCVAVSDDVMDAFDRIDALNKAAKMLLLVLATGKKPVGLTQADLDELVEAWVGKV